MSASCAKSRTLGEGCLCGCCFGAFNFLCKAPGIGAIIHASTPALGASTSCAESFTNWGGGEEGKCCSDSGVLWQGATALAHWLPVQNPWHLGRGVWGLGGGGERLRMLGRVSPRSSVYPLPAQSLSHWGRGKEDARASGLLSRSPLPALVHDPSPAAAATATAALLEFAALLHSTLVSLTLHPGFFPRQWVPQHSPFLRQREINSLHRHVK